MSLATATQYPLLPNQPPIHWLFLTPDVWDWQEADSVHRDTENAALRSIQQQARLYQRARVLSLTPLHRRVRELERYFMERYPHYQPQEVEQGIAERMNLSTHKIKRVLLDISLIYHLAIEAGLDWIIDNTQRSGHYY